MLPVIWFVTVSVGCTTSQDVPPDNLQFRDDMRAFVGGLSDYAKLIDPSFIIIPQNGHDLVTRNGLPDGQLSVEYLGAIDGMGREDLFYGYYADNWETPKAITDGMTAFLDLAAGQGVHILVTDYCKTKSYIDNSYTYNAAKGYLSFAADRRNLDGIPEYPPEPYDINTDNIESLAQARNFLYFINPGSYTTRQDFITALSATNYDLIIMDLFFDGTDQITAADIEHIKTKANGGRRLVIAYMSIGEAEDYRYYWSDSWKADPPTWLSEENPDWPGNYKVQYWDPGWQEIIYGTDGSYLKKIIDAGFDGAYLDIIDAFEYFENQ